MVEDELRRACGDAAPELIRRWKKAQEEGRIFTREQAIAYAQTLPVACMDIPGNIPGSIQRRCGVCHKPVWAAPSTQEVLRERTGPSLIVCAVCLTGRFAEVERFLAASDEAHGIKSPEDQRGTDSAR